MSSKKFKDTLVDKSDRVTGLIDTVHFKYAAQVDSTLYGVYLDVNAIVNGGIKGSAAGKVTLYLSIFATSETNLDTIIIYVCGSAGTPSNLDHYNQEVGSAITVTTGYLVKQIDLEITNKDATYATVAQTGGAVISKII